MKSDPARIFVIGLVTMFILIGIAAVIGAIMNPHYDKLHRRMGWNCMGNNWNVDRSTLPLHIHMDNSVVCKIHRMDVKKLQIFLTQQMDMVGS